MTNTMKITLALVLFLAAITVVVGSPKIRAPADTAASPAAVEQGGETPVRGPKGDRLDIYPKIRTITGVTMVMRDFGPAIR